MLFLCLLGAVAHTNTPIQEAMDKQDRERQPEKFMNVRELSVINRSNMDWIPKAIGPFEEVFRRKQNQYNAHIAIATGLFLASLYYVSNYILSNLCKATSGSYINFGCSGEVLFLRGHFQISMVNVTARGRYICRSLEVPL